MSTSQPCYHCGEPIPSGSDVIFADLPRQQAPVCCVGCKAVCEHIHHSGLSVYYQYRTELGSKPNTADASQFQVYDNPEYLAMVSDKIDDHTSTITLSVENIHCAACAWLIEQALHKLDGITKISVNTVNERATITWLDKQIALSEILATLTSIGYPSAPFSVSDLEKRIKRQDKQYIKRLGVAGLFTMQVMMLAIAMYYGAFSNMESHQTSYFKWISFALSIPVVFYSALPFLKGAITAIRSKALTMDVSVAVAIYGAFFISFYQLLKYGFDGNKGEVYFESIAMFTLLLLIGKYLEFKAKSKAVLSNANLNKSLPVFVNKLVGQSETDTSPSNFSSTLVHHVQVGDIILIKPGEQLPVDGEIVSGKTTVNESVITGEFNPVFKSPADVVLAGSINNEGTINVRVSAIGQHTTLASMGRLQEEFASHKPKMSQFADTISNYFVFGQLLIAIATYFVWLSYQPEDAIWVGLSVLVATCPCALSLATPTAYTCIMSRLNRHGILVKDAEAFERLTTISHVAFDKTGTLTTGQFTVLEQDYPNSSLALETVKSLVVQLQSQSEHPIAKAFNNKTLGLVQSQSVAFSQVTSHIGEGITATYQGLELRIGNQSFTRIEPAAGNTTHNVFVSLDGQLIASFLVKDHLKDGSKHVIQALKNTGRKTLMITGDPSHSGQVLAQELAVDHSYHGCRPEQKAQQVVKLQEQGHRVLMIGDGINDAPVFAAADVAIAMSSGADISKFGSDIIILNNHLSAVQLLFKTAQQTRQTIRKNLYWSLVYNAVILPVAVLGYVAPYVAVIGMSLSSIFVVTNSLRLLKDN